MDLYSCDQCATVLDLDKLVFPKLIEDEDGVIRDDLAIWFDRAWRPFTRCPVCRGRIVRSSCDCVTTFPSDEH